MTTPTPIQIKIFFMHRLRSCMKFAMRIKFVWERQAPVQPNVNPACNYNCKVFAPKQCVRWTYICVCTCNWVPFICSLPRIITLFSTCVSVNFYPLRELDTIGTGRILLLATFHSRQVLHKCILPCILPILESRGKEIHKAFGKSNALFIAQPCSWKFWLLQP